MAKIVLFGAGQIGSVACVYLRCDSPHEVVAFTMDAAYIGEKEHMGLPVVAFEEVEASFPPDRFKMFLPISYKNVNKLRAEKYRQAKEKGYELISYVSSKAITWPEVKIGENCFILENNVIQPFAEIGNDVVLWSGNHIGHHSRIEDHCFLASHIVVSGSVIVEPYCFIGINVSIRDNVTIARECVLGAGVTILKTTKEREVYVAAGSKPHTLTSDKLRHI